ncbi:MULTISPECIES: RNA polymerase sigma factor [Nocardioides]|uniref:RNA polymerase sigma factor n=1 Tax=Nocardioides TaxID=1839 RepID=UPI001409C17A|nr:MULTISPECIES: sigma-70 family RNA polymerase sigma factor [Nocardioides]
MEDDVCRALDELRSASEPGLLRYAYLLCGNIDDAQDLVQEAFLSLAKRGSSLSAVEHLDRYAMRAIHNHYVTQYRRAEMMRRLVPRLQHPDREAQQQDNQEAIASRDQLWRALRRLKPNQRCALVLRYYLDWTDAAIADVLVCSPSTARSHLARGLAEMRTHWDFDSHAPSTQTMGKKDTNREPRI